MNDIACGLRRRQELDGGTMLPNDARRMMRDAAAEIERLRLWIRRIDNINDNPARFSSEIDQACIDALAGKPMVGLISAYQQSVPSSE